MLYTYSREQQKLTTDENIVFTNVDFDTNCSITGTSGSSAIKLNKAGFYEVSYSASVANGTGVLAKVGTEMNANGEPYAGAVSIVASNDSSDIRNISFTVGVHVRPNCCQVTNNVPLILTFKNVGADAEYTDVNLTIKKIR